jgi:hypothetical protein
MENRDRNKEIVGDKEKRYRRSEKELHTETERERHSNRH